jgi:hypothetical protein
VHGCLSVVLCVSGRGLCDELITRPEEFYRLWRVVVCDQETARTRRPWRAIGPQSHENNDNNNIYIILLPSDNSIAVSNNNNNSIILTQSKLCVILLCKGNGKAKFTLEQATKAQRGSRGIALLFP